MVVLVVLLLCIMYISTQVKHASNVFKTMANLMVAENQAETKVKTVVKLNGNMMKNPISFNCMTFRPHKFNEINMYGEEGGSFECLFYCRCEPYAATIGPSIYIDNHRVWLINDQNAYEYPGEIFIGDKDNPLAIPTVLDSFHLTITVRVVETPFLYSNLLNAPDLIPNLRKVCKDNDIALPTGVTAEGEGSAIAPGKRIIRVDFNGKPLFEIPLWYDKLHRWGKIDFDGMTFYQEH